MDAVFALADRISVACVRALPSPPGGARQAAIRADPAVARRAYLGEGGGLT